MSEDYTIASNVLDAPREVLNLNGEWDIAFDPENAGKAQEWVKSFPTEVEKIEVPSVFETVRPFYDGVAWYRTQFTVSTGEHTLHRLQFGAAQYYAEAWLNGVRIGDHEGGLLPFEFDVSKTIIDGENELIVRVIGPPMDREIDGFRCGAPLNQGTIPIAKLGWYFNVGGLWRDVSLASSRTVAITDVFVEPWPSRDEMVAHVDLSSQGNLGKCVIECTISDWQSEETVLSYEHECNVAAGTSLAEFKVPFAGARRWTLDDPHLYFATFTIRAGGDVLDAHKVRFGMREFDCIDGEFKLNDKPVVLKGFLHQGDFPRTAIYPDSHDIVFRELRQVKELGFNFLRCHMRPHFEVLDLADELGLLVESEPPIGWIANSPETADRCWREISGLVRNDRNRPCVVMWGLMNEVFHLKGFKPKEMLALVNKWLKAVHAMDPTRPVIDVSGGHSLVEYGGVSDMLPDTAHDGNVAYMLSPNSPTPVALTDTHSYHRVPTQDDSWQNFRVMGGPGRQVFVSEYGAAQVPPDFDTVLAAYSDKDREIGLEDYRMNVDFNASLESAFAHDWLREAVGSKKDWIARTNQMRAEDMKLVTFAMRSNPSVSGLVFTQLADASGELFGAMDTWRNPKPMLHALADSCADDALAIFPSTRILKPGEAFGLELMLLHESTTELASWQLKIVNEGGESVREWSGSIGDASHRDVLLQENALTLADSGAYRICSTLIFNDESTCENSVDLWVVDQVPLTIKEAAVSGKRAGELAALLQQEGAVNFPFSNNFREPHMPILYDFRGAAEQRSASAFEDYSQLRKAIKGGGCAVAFEPEPLALYQYLIPGLIRQRPVMQPNCYATSNEIFEGLGGAGVVDIARSPAPPLKFDRIEDILELGGRILYGGLSAHMWTRPAKFFHGAAMYELPLGDGCLIVCHLPLLDMASENPVARRILINLINYAAAKIKNPSIEGLLSRSIDPLPDEEYI